MPATRFTWQLQLNAPQRRHAAQRMRHAAHVRPVGIQQRQGDVLQVAQRRQRPKPATRQTPLTQCAQSSCRSKDNRLQEIVDGEAPQASNDAPPFQRREPQLGHIKRPMMRLLCSVGT